MVGKSPMQKVLEHLIKMDVQNDAEKAIHSVNKFLNKNKGQWQNRDNH